MSTNLKASHLIKELTDQSKIVNVLSKRFSSHTSIKNEDILADTLLDHKTFYRDKNRFEFFLDYLKEIIM